MLNIIGKNEMSNTLIYVNIFIALLIISEKKTLLSLSFICIEADSVHDRLNIEKKLLSIEGNLHAIE